MKHGKVWGLGPRPAFPMRRVPAVILASCTGLALGPSPANALEPAAAGVPAPAPRLSFRWNAPEHCPAREALLARAERLLGHPLESSLTTPLSIDATATELGAESWELRLVSGEADAAPRLVRAASCADLGEMAALFTALSIDPTLHVESTSTFADMSEPPKDATPPDGAAPPPDPPAAPPATPEPEPPARAANKPRPTPSKAPLHVRPLAGLSLALGLGRLPGMALGVSAEGGVALDRLSVRGQLGYFPEKRAEVTPTAGGDLSVGTAGARAVYVLFSGAATASLSAGVTLGWMHGTGAGVANKSSGDALLLSFEPGARAECALSPSFALVADAMLALAANRPRFVLDGAQEVFRPPRIGARFGLGAEWSPP